MLRRPKIPVIITNKPKEKKNHIGRKKKSLLYPSTNMQFTSFFFLTDLTLFEYLLIYSEVSPLILILHLLVRYYGQTYTVFKNNAMIKQVKNMNFLTMRSNFWKKWFWRMIIPLFSFHFKRRKKKKNKNKKPPHMF